MQDAFLHQRQREWEEVTAQGMLGTNSKLFAKPLPMALGNFCGLDLNKKSVSSSLPVSIPSVRQRDPIQLSVVSIPLAWLQGRYLHLLDILKLGVGIPVCQVKGCADFLCSSFLCLF